MIQKEESHIAASIGGTIAAILVAVIVLVIVSIVVSFLASMMNYYMSSMRIEAATFIGGIIGGVAGMYAARASCDAVIKSYSGRAIFIVLCALFLGQIVYEIDQGISWSTLPPMAQWLAVLFVGFSLFWNEEAL